ncbi:MAG TPA: hypothetical protein DCL98_03460 [Flavobacteriales bacterium]|nr:hypothetical protein [Flavobacteriales bacterium]
MRQASQTVDARANRRCHVHGQRVPHGGPHDDEVMKPSPVHIHSKGLQQALDVFPGVQGPHKHEEPLAPSVLLSHLGSSQI